MTIQTVISVKEMRKSYGGIKAVKGVSFEVTRGEIFGLLGPNGAGKTTMVECLQGLRRADSGKLRVLDLDPDKQKQELRHKIGSQLQESALPDKMKVWEAFDLFSSLIPGGTDWHTHIQQWGLVKKSDTYFGKLSGGEKQRLFVALALLNDPIIVFLDEMTTGLDPSARRTAWELIRKIRDTGTTVILVTHFMEEAENLCDRVAIIEGGKLVKLDSPQKLINTYAKTTTTFSTEIKYISWIDEIPHVDNVERRGSIIEVKGDGQGLFHLASELKERGIVPEDLHVKQPTLEDVYLKITRTEKNGRGG